MKSILSFIFICLISFSLKVEVTPKAKTAEKKDLGCITLLKLASEKSKNAEEMTKYEKLKKLQKTSKVNIKMTIFQKMISNQK